MSTLCNSGVSARISAFRIVRWCEKLIPHGRLFSYQLAFQLIHNLYFFHLRLLFFNMPFSIRSLISLTAESLEHFAILAHFDDVNFPSKPSNRCVICNENRFYSSQIKIIRCLFCVKYCFYLLHNHLKPQKI